jgi:hypothetical protein
MNTGRYHKPEIIISKAASLVGDSSYEFKSKAGYISIVQKAIEELAITTYFEETWKSFEFPENLTLEMPGDCFNIRDIYLFDGQACDIGKSRKVYWKRNYYTEGKGYVANDKWENGNDPFYPSHNMYPGGAYPDNLASRSLIRYQNNPGNIYFYNIQNGNIMFSSSCKNAGQRIMLHYNGLGCEFGEAPLIPALYRTAIEDYVCEFVLREKMAVTPSQATTQLWKIYDNRLNNPMNGSWKEAEMRAKKMNASQRQELNTYLGRADYGRNR